MTFHCIGQSRDGHGNLVRCTAESHAPTNPQRPEWGWLCSACANGSSKKATLAAREYTNVGAMQADKDEYREQCEKGFMLGMGQEDSDE